MRTATSIVCDGGRPILTWGVPLALLLVVFVGAPATLVAQEAHAAPEQEHAEQAGEAHEATEEHGEEHAEEHGEHFHKNHIALFVGSTEAEEHHGEKGDRDFTLGVDYERRLSSLFGIGGMFDWVVEGRREFLVGPIGFIHPYKGLKFYAAPCYQHIREGDKDDFVFRIGGTWDFEVGKYSVGPHLIYDFASEQDFFVFGVGIGRGF